MIDELYVQRSGDAREPRRETFIGRAWDQLTAWVVVHQDESGRAQVDRPTDYFARVDRHPIDGPDAQEVIPYQTLFDVEIQYPKSLYRTVGEVRPQIVVHLGAVGEDWTGRHARAKHMGDDIAAVLEIGYDAFVARRRAQLPSRRGREQTSEAAELPDQAFGMLEIVRGGTTEYPDEMLQSVGRVLFACIQIPRPSRATAGHADHVAMIW